MIGEKTLLHFKWYALKFIVGYALEKHESKSNIAFKFKTTPHDMEQKIDMKMKSCAVYIIAFVLCSYTFTPFMIKTRR